ncbi:MAG: beta-lactamase family protein [Actinobacteria bacterium]|nr:beta-lactamase family protein [Actinomycetota bacterium]
MDHVGELIERTAIDSGFSGAVRIDRGDGSVIARAFGMADRRHQIANTVDTQFAIASGTKGFTALAVMALVDDGVLQLDTTARSVLADDLPLIAPDVTVEHLLSHRSGIGDYLDESALGDVGDYVMPVPVHRLACAEDYLAVLDGHPQVFAPGTDFAYCNGGYVVLALIAERASAVPWPDLVRTRVCEPAGMTDTELLRSDDLPGRAATGYVMVGGAERSNVLHLPVVGVGDGGLSTTVADIRRFWEALFAGRIVPTPRVDEMIRCRSDPLDGSARYGLGFWLDAHRCVPRLEGYDAGVSFRSWHDPATRSTCTIVSNTSEGAWPMCRALADIV